MFLSRISRRSLVVASASLFLFLTALTVTATQSPRFSFIASIQEFLGTASTATPIQSPAPMRQLAETTNILAPAPQPLFTINTTSVSLTALGTASTQNFDTLASTGTSTTLGPDGWYFSETGSNANTVYTAGTGGSSTGDTYSFGIAGTNPVTDRALGGLLSSSLVPTFGVSFTNNTGGTIKSLAISYTGEQWRLGATGRADQIDFQYSTDATSLVSGTWVDVNALDFSSPNTTSGGILDGNAVANRTAISGTISGIAIANGGTFWLRWNDFNASGSDDGLGVDDFSLTPLAAPSISKSFTTSPINVGQ